MKTLSTNGLNLIKSFEGCYLTAYDDLQPKVKLTPTTKIKGTLTIGWGSTKNVKIGQTITRQQADQLLLNDLKSYIATVNNKTIVPFTEQLNQNQFDALVSFCYNCGGGNLKKLCNGGIAKIPTNILLYVKSKGTTLKGLERRRQAERDLFIKKEEKPLSNYVDTDSEIITAIQTKIKELEKQVSLFDKEVKDIDPPIWILQQFPKVLDYITANEKGEKKLPYNVWRSIAIALRYVKINN